jgi:hypothetical protein
MTGVPFIPGTPPDPGPGLPFALVAVPAPVIILTAVYVLPALVTTMLTGVPSFKVLATILASRVNVVELE